MKGSTLLLLGAGAVGAWWFIFEGPGKAVKAATQALSSSIATVYEALTFGPAIQVTGDVDDTQGNLLGPIASFPAAHDSQGNTYLQINGHTFQLGPRDARGNFTAIPTVQASGS